MTTSDRPSLRPHDGVSMFQERLRRKSLCEDVRCIICSVDGQGLDNSVAIELTNEGLCDSVMLGCSVIHSLGALDHDAIIVGVNIGWILLMISEFTEKEAIPDDLLGQRLEGVCFRLSC